MELIGAIEHVSIPVLELFGLDGKIDTGADSCALHCDAVMIEGDRVTFILHDSVHAAYHGKKISMPIYKTKKVKSSNGKSQIRVFIKTALQLGMQTYEAEISLADRTHMKYPFLIGRKFLMHRYLIDVSKKYLTKESV